MFRRLTLLGLGAGLMYFLDPERGRRRRALVRDQMTHLSHEFDEVVGKTTRDLTNRTRGLVAEVESRFSGSGLVADNRVLVERVRSKMGRLVSNPHSLVVRAQDGQVTLTGPVLASEVSGLVSAIASVRGVARVDNQLQVYQHPGEVPGLQGAGGPAGERSELLQNTWSPTTRLLVGAACGALLYSVAPRRGLLRLSLGAAGLGLIASGLQHMSDDGTLPFGTRPSSAPVPGPQRYIGADI